MLPTTANYSILKWLYCINPRFFIQATYIGITVTNGQNTLPIRVIPNEWFSIQILYLICFFLETNYQFLERVFHPNLYKKITWAESWGKTTLQNRSLADHHLKYAETQLSLVYYWTDAMKYARIYRIKSNNIACAFFFSHMIYNYKHYKHLLIITYAIAFRSLRQAPASCSVFIKFAKKHGCNLKPGDYTSRSRMTMDSTLIVVWKIFSYELCLKDSSQQRHLIGFQWPIKKPHRRCDVVVVHRMDSSRRIQSYSKNALNVFDCFYLRKIYNINNQS